RTRIRSPDAPRLARAHRALVGCGLGPEPECRASREHSTPIGACDPVKASSRSATTCGSSRSGWPSGESTPFRQPTRQNPLAAAHMFWARIRAGLAYDESNLLHGLDDEPVAHTGSRGAACLPALSQQLHAALRLT